eukprot:TRINITY_DN20871_c0_g1_i1.p1 TRINITY_DN20871_c0_g1~~TRINITY_DN20871_c0_g1_i1.p1  ORF type:complete len:849 (+),score=190.46 TRINITY_DN20871_c0_g1_i1:81-2627(+)
MGAAAPMVPLDVVAVWLQAELGGWLRDLNILHLFLLSDERAVGADGPRAYFLDKAKAGAAGAAKVLGADAASASVLAPVVLEAGRFKMEAARVMADCADRYVALKQRLSLRHAAYAAEEKAPPPRYLPPGHAHHTNTSFAGGPLATTLSVHADSLHHSQHAAHPPHPDMLQTTTAGPLGRAGRSLSSSTLTTTTQGGRWGTPAVPPPPPPLAADVGGDILSALQGAGGVVHADPAAGVAAPATPSLPSSAVASFAAGAAPSRVGSSSAAEGSGIWASDHPGVPPQILPAGAQPSWRRGGGAPAAPPRRVKHPHADGDESVATPSSVPAESFSAVDDSAAAAAAPSSQSSGSAAGPVGTGARSRLSSHKSLGAWTQSTATLWAPPVAADAPASHAPLRAPSSIAVADALSSLQGSQASLPVNASDAPPRRIESSVFAASDAPASHHPPSAGAAPTDGGGGESLQSLPVHVTVSIPVAEGASHGGSEASAHLLPSAESWSAQELPAAAPLHDAVRSAGLSSADGLMSSHRGSGETNVLGVGPMRAPSSIAVADALTSHRGSEAGVQLPLNAAPSGAGEGGVPGAGPMRVPSSIAAADALTSHRGSEASNIAVQPALHRAATAPVGAAERGRRVSDPRRRMPEGLLRDPHASETRHVVAGDAATPRRRSEPKPCKPLDPKELFGAAAEAGGARDTETGSSSGVDDDEDDYDDDADPSPCTTSASPVHPHQPQQLPVAQNDDLRRASTLTSLSASPMAGDQPRRAPHPFATSPSAVSPAFSGTSSAPIGVHDLYDAGGTPRASSDGRGPAPPPGRPPSYPLPPPSSPSADSGDTQELLQDAWVAQTLRGGAP